MADTWFSRSSQSAFSCTIRFSAVSSSFLSRSVWVLNRSSLPSAAVSSEAAFFAADSVSRIRISSSAS